MSETDALPPVSTELAILRVLIEAHMRSMKPPARVRWERALVEVLSELDEGVVRMRPASQHAAIAQARKQSDAWLRRVLLHAMGRG